MTPTTPLRTQLLQAFESSDAAARATALRERRVVIFGPQSTLGLIHLPLLVAAGADIVLAVDDRCREAQLHGVPVVGSGAFVAGAARVRDAVLVDFSVQPYGRVLCRSLGAATGIEVADALLLLAAWDCPSVYQTVPDYRARTLARADDWLALAERLADDFSRETLYAVLLQRIEHDRSALINVNIGGRDEYFGATAACDTFRLGARERFIDCGAHRGTIVQKLLSCTEGRYESIDAFEPDAGNRAALAWLTPVPLRSFRVHASAVSDVSGTLRFAQTGTMGSHVTEAGDVQVQATALDDVVDDATFIKMDVEGFEPRALRGAARLISTRRPRLTIASYHYAEDLLDVARTLDEIAPGYVLRLRHHLSYYYDSILYASTHDNWLPPDRAC